MPEGLLGASRAMRPGRPSLAFGTPGARVCGQRLPATWSLAILSLRPRCCLNLRSPGDGHPVFGLVAPYKPSSSVFALCRSRPLGSRSETLAPRVSAALNQLAWVLHRGRCFSEFAGAALVRPNVRANRPAEARVPGRDADNVTWAAARPGTLAVAGPVERGVRRHWLAYTGHMEF